MLPVMQDTRGNSIRLSDGAVVCGCNTVGKNAVVAAKDFSKQQVNERIVELLSSS